MLLTFGFSVTKFNALLNAKLIGALAPFGRGSGAIADSRERWFNGRRGSS